MHAGIYACHLWVWLVMHTMQVSATKVYLPKPAERRSDVRYLEQTALEIAIANRAVNSLRVMLEMLAAEAPVTPASTAAEHAPAPPPPEQDGQATNAAATSPEKGSDAAQDSGAAGQDETQGKTTGPAAAQQPAAPAEAPRRAVDTVDNYGQSLLMLAVQNPSKTVAWVLEQGVGADGGTGEVAQGAPEGAGEGTSGEGSEMRSTGYIERRVLDPRYISIVQLLLDHGALVNYQDPVGFTALHCAVHARLPEVRNTHGWTAWRDTEASAAHCCLIMACRVYVGKGHCIMPNCVDCVACRLLGCFLPREQTRTLFTSLVDSHPCTWRQRSKQRHKRTRKCLITCLHMTRYESWTAL